MKTRREILALGAQATAGLTASGLWLPAQLSRPALATTALRKPIPYGAAINPYKLTKEQIAKDPLYGPAYVELCDVIVAETGMKWPDLQPKRDKFGYELANRVKDFAKAHNLKMRGHTLVWDCRKNNPEWVNAITDKDDALRVLKGHVTTVVKKFSSIVSSCDVINEPLTTKCGHDKRPGPSIWAKLLERKEDYMVEALRAAREADKHVQLVINEVGLETADDAQKRDDLIALVKLIKQRNGPIDAIGMQCHLGGHRDIDVNGIRTFVAKLKEMEVDVLVTELDVKDYMLKGTTPAQRDDIMARKVGQLLLAVDSPTAVLTWGLTDKYSRLNEHKTYGRKDGRPLPLDRNYGRKEMMNVIQAFCRGKR